MTAEKILYDVAVIGAGPAGCAAAVQCRRLGLEVILADTSCTAGGLLCEARCIENYPGLERPLKGPEFAERLNSFIAEHGIEIRRFHADSITGIYGKFEISGSKAPVRARTVIIAVGTVPRKLAVRVNGTAVIHRSILALKKQPPERTVIIGGGEAALDYALNLSDSGSAVKVLVRGSQLRAVGDLAREIEKHSSINILYNTAVVSASRSDGSIHLDVESAEGRISLETDALLGAVGREPKLPVLMKDFDHSRGNIRTSIQGLYLVGDASLGSLGQAAIASGQGVLAAIFANELLRAERGG